jgi:hypothetical protein
MSSSKNRNRIVGVVLLLLLLKKQRICLIRKHKKLREQKSVRERISRIYKIVFFVRRSIRKRRLICVLYFLNSQSIASRLIEWRSKLQQTLTRVWFILVHIKIAKLSNSSEDLNKFMAGERFVGNKQRARCWKGLLLCTSFVAFLQLWMCVQQTCTHSTHKVYGVRREFCDQWMKLRSKKKTSKWRNFFSFWNNSSSRQ